MTTKEESFLASLDPFLREQWFWVALGCAGYLLSLYAILFGLGFSAVALSFPLVALPLAIKKLDMRERLRASALISLCSYFVFLTILVYNSYFPTTAEMVLELFFILLVTIPAFLIRAPMYLLFGIGSVDNILLLSGAIFLLAFAFSIRHVREMHQRSQYMMLAVVLISIFITTSECIELGKGIQKITQVSSLDPTVRNYYRVADAKPELFQE